MSGPTVITRFAPSPTGYLHVGGARTALYSWLLARHHGGRFLLRIEDTDLARSTEQACAQLLDDLRWLGLHWDNAELVYQSKRKAVYDAVIDNLLARGLAYRAYETTEELEAMRKAAEREKRSFAYRRRPITARQERQYQAEGRPNVVRFAMPVKEHRFRDEVLDKEIVLPAEEAQDFVIRKADGMPTYHFAVVVDDAEMQVTHVLRGQEHLKNTFYHIALQEALGYPRPLYGHLPVILNTDGSKMGKRDRDKLIRQRCAAYLKQKRMDAAALAAAAELPPQQVADWLADTQKQLDIDQQSAVMAVIGMQSHELPEILVHDFRRNGYLPEALLNFLALLGWNPGENRERMTIQEMVQLFRMEDIGKSNARFNREKLLAFNTEACASAAPQRLLAAMRDFLAVNPESPLNQADDAMLTRLLAMKKGFRTLREVEQTSRFFFIADGDVAYDADAVEKVLKKGGGQGLAALRDVRQVLASAADWTAASLEAAITAYCTDKNLGLGKVAQPIRVAISGTTISPPIFQSIELLGRDRTLARIDRCIAAAS